MAGVFERGLLEGFDALRFHSDLNVDNQHGAGAVIEG
jgi:hypothetical protein